MYIDLDKIKVHKGYVYYWHMTDFLEPINGVMSMMIYNQADCGVGRSKDLASKFFTESMGMGEGDPFTPDDEWFYPGPNTTVRVIFDYVCEYVN